MSDAMQPAGQGHLLYDIQGVVKCGLCLHEQRRLLRQSEAAEAGVAGSSLATTGKANHLAGRC